MNTAPGRRAAQAAAVAFGLVTLAVGLASVPLDDMAHQPGPKGPLSLAFVVVVMVPAVAVGTLLAVRRPRNPIGWLLMAIFLLVVAPVGDYAIIDYRMHHGTLPLGSVAVVLSTSFPLWLVLIAITLWVFPDGLLPAGRWRPVAVIAVTAGVLMAVVATAAGAASVAGHAVVIDAAGNLANKTTGLTSALQGLTVLGALASPIGFAVLPVCVGVAVLKYRLYDIDRIISRVISYAIVTAVLAGVFAGVVVLISVVLPLKGSVAIAASTLVAAALFNPLRRRVQRAIDRRFNRARYNAEAVVAAFTSRLRQTVDLDEVRGDLVGVVHDAFQPAHVSVWLTGPGRVTRNPDQGRAGGLS